MIQHYSLIERNARRDDTEPHIAAKFGASRAWATPSSH
jgi:hypothetical protein